MGQGEIVAARITVGVGGQCVLGRAKNEIQEVGMATARPRAINISICLPVPRALK